MQTKHRLLSRWVVVLPILLAIPIACVFLWRYQALRPYLTGIGAGLAAALAPVPGLVAPEARGKWLFTIGIASLIGVATWYSGDQVERERQRLDRRVRTDVNSFGSTIAKVSNQDFSRFAIAAGDELRRLYLGRQIDETLDLAEVVARSDPNNGHALYFSGEAYRGLGRRTDMRSAFKKYLAEAEHRPSEALSGDAAMCYQRPSGYCAERTQLIGHFMASDYLTEARAVRGNAKAQAALTSLAFEREILDSRPRGFRGEGSMPSSCEVLDGIRLELSNLGRPTTDVDGALGRYRSAWKAVQQSPPC